MAETTEELLYQHIKNAIRKGIYPSGMRLIPETLAAEHGVSRMPVRQALRKLTTEGFVSSLPNRRLVVSQIDLAAMKEIFEMRAVLEGLAIRLAREKMNSAHTGRLETRLMAMEQHIGDTSQWSLLHRQFHEDIYRHCERPMLLQQISNLLTLVEPYMQVWISDTVFQQHALLGHREILDAVNHKNAEQCEQIMREHIMNTLPDLTELYCKQ
ncbi:GntR family transcriptional regulator [Martelella alba]|uniref:GntR family transcriptional regulator n=1 Tax=Martelella alba TaxID=2590451 RepID=A0ABY2SPC8_9HYPH|nr:GntR family transcriptional regulator [Martelella alba]TKI07751.1 GntR family transcriptional regulator [Martelella alba]